MGRRVEPHPLLLALIFAATADGFGLHHRGAFSQATRPGGRLGHTLCGRSCLTPRPDHPTALAGEPREGGGGETYTLKERNPYDVHVYYQPAEAAEAEALRERMRVAFPWMRFYEPKGRPIGPHPCPMWEADFGEYKNRDRLCDVRDFLCVQHGGLSVLIHPHSTDGDYADHTRNAIWFGEKLELRIGGGGGWVPRNRL